jgi:hypothetical protein
VQNDILQRAMDFQPTVVVNESQFSELVHERLTRERVVPWLISSSTPAKRGWRGFCSCLLHFGKDGVAYGVVPRDQSGDLGRDGPKEKKVNNPPPVLQYRRVAVADLNRGRRGKHHDLVQGILQELRLPSPGSALEIPLAEVDGTGLASLRSAVHRASISEGLSIETFADEKNFYVWTKSPTRNRVCGATNPLTITRCALGGTISARSITVCVLQFCILLAVSQLAIHARIATLILLVLLHGALALILIPRIVHGCALSLFS